MITLAGLAFCDIAKASPTIWSISSERDLKSAKIQIHAEEKVIDGTINGPVDRFYTIKWTPHQDYFPNVTDRVITVVVYPKSTSDDPKDHEPIVRSVFTAKENGDIEAKFSFKEKSEFHLEIYLGDPTRLFYRLKLKDYLDGFAKVDP
ncbi:MAG: hypothetical protein KDN20_11345 [Verrucomicrobiae bacterium]|nr:hypothetical protein [Verrucomicrobiae bacterium]